MCSVSEYFRVYFTYNVLSLKKLRFYYSSPKRFPAIIVVLKIPGDPEFVIKLTSLTVVHAYTERSVLYLHIYNSLSLSETHSGSP